MAHKKPCAKYQYVVTPSGPKILPVDEPSCKDEESPADYNAGGYLPVKVNDTFKNNRYRVVRKLGWGHFSTVWLAKDSSTHRHSALKVVKSAGRYAETARDEIKLLSQVQSFSPNHPGRCHIVSFLDSFTHQGPESSHICIVFEPLGENLLALIERHKKRGVPKALVRVIAKQILLGLEYLHDECDLVHTDIKPENILICIAEIEDHIQCELSRSPSPTSRRVGVPLPTKTRSGVTIPQLHQRPRRQVQIFDSQPFISPSRSLVRSGHVQSPHPGSYGSPIKPANPPVAAYNSMVNVAPTAPKVPSGLSTSSVREGDSTGKTSQHQPQPKAVSDSPPSTSSSSSSITSIVASTTVTTGSSNISTPPTSLPHSLTVGGLPHPLVSGDLHSHLASFHQSDVKISESRKSRLLPAHLDPKGKARARGECNSVNVPQLPCHSATDCDVNSNTHRSDHLRSLSGASTSGFWKDPGAAAPAPALVVSAVVGAAGADGDCLELSNTTVQEVTQGSSSGEAVAESLIIPSTNPKPKSLLHGVHRIITSNLFLHDRKSFTPEKQSFRTHTSGPSLLTQTAPSRHNPSQENPSAHSISPSSPRQSSHPSANNNRRRSSSCKCTDPEHKHRAVTDSHRKDPKCRTQQDGGSRTIGHGSSVKLVAVDTSASSSTTPTLSPPPPVPPTTPSDDQRFAYGKLNMESSRAVPYRERNHNDSKEESLLAVTPPPIFIKIADLGNATPSSKHYTEDIQTRQYRAPEAILGRNDWDTRTDIWSVACLIFELLTAEYLFDPQGQGELFTKDDDHMAQIIELMGDFPLEIKMGGKYSRELFDHSGALRYIRALKFWPLKRVMVEKYLHTEAESASLCDFLEPMLAVDMRLRAHARDVKSHKWLEACETDEPVTEW